jgi:hypothetical protein
MAAPYTPSLNDAMISVTNATSKLSSIGKKIDDAKHRIQVEESSFLSSRQPLEKDKGYNYYLRERENASKTGGIACNEIGTKIEALEKKKEDIEREYERKKELLLEELERKKEMMIKEIDNKIEALDRKKELERESSQERADKHQKNLEGIISKYESMKPTSVVYSRLIAHVEELEKEKLTAEEAHREAISTMMRAQQRHLQSMQHEAANRERELRREQAIRDQEELRGIELREAATRREEEERAKRRVEEDNRRFREEQRKEVQIVSKPPLKQEEEQEYVEEDPMTEFLFAKNNQWTGWWLNSLYSREMYLEDKKHCKQEVNGVPAWKMSNWYKEEME